MDGRVWQIVVDSFGKLLIPGITVTIPLTLVSFAIGLALAIIVALTRVARTPVLTQIAQFYVWVFRGTPLLVQLFVIFFGLPSIGVTIPAIPSAIIAFSLNVGAYASETLRGAIEAVPRGQFEAGYATNMSYVTIMRRIVLPQAFRIITPPLTNELILLTKDSSLVYVLGLTASAFELTKFGRDISNSNGNLTPLVVAGFCYLLITLPLTLLVRRMEAKSAKAR